MKNYLVFTILLLSNVSKIIACGYTPYGEDVRYCLFKPQYFQYRDYYAFYYNANLWGYDYEYRRIDDVVDYEANILDWYNYIHKKIPIDAIKDFNNSLKLTDINEYSQNDFLKYLYKNKKYEIIQYLIYAKKCEGINTLNLEDSWEKNKKESQLGKQKILGEIKAAYGKEKNDYLKRKYAFQCIRMAYYTGNESDIISVFTKEFKNSKKDYLYYWSLYFYCFTTTGQSKMVDIAEIFANCPEKTFASYFYFSSDFKLSSALKFAKNKNDVANLYAYVSAQTEGKNLENLKIIYANNSKCRVLDFLLLREINKIEDWVYTPYYTNYCPSVEAKSLYSDSKYDDKITTETLRSRSEKDRLYAQEVLDFINTVDFSKIKNHALWKASQIQLLFITRNYTECLSAVKQFERQDSKEPVLNEIEKIKAICITANQSFGKAIIKEEVKSIITDNMNDSRFLFAVGRELEYNGNLSDGIALLSLSKRKDYTYDGNDVEWRGNRLKTTDNFDVFYEYFDYLDFVYSANELQVIVNKLNTSFDNDFEKKIYKVLIDDKAYLTDLLGTKYIREDKLPKALFTFSTLNESYWTDNYNAWERKENEDVFIFDYNPFYTLKHSDFIDHKEKFIVTKLSVTEHLIKFLNLADNPKTADRDYYYFLIANCYFNMSDKGNSWMMRRFRSNWSSNEGYEDVSYIDEREYRLKDKAVAYYQLAYANAKTDKFKALCLRMMDYANKGYPNDFKKLKKEYPQYYQDLSNCDYLDNYFKARR